MSEEGMSYGSVFALAVGRECIGLDTAADESITSEVVFHAEGGIWTFKISRDGITANPDIPIDETAKAVIDAMRSMYEVEATYGSVSSGQAPASRWQSVNTDSLTQVLAQMRDELPGWWWSGGVCSVSAHASCGPDAAGPDAWLLSDRAFDEGFDADLPQPAELADALRAVIGMARKARAKAYEEAENE